MHQKALVSRIIGFLASLLLTLAAYFIMVYPEFLQLRSGVAIYGILMLALLQATVQFIYFLDLWREKGPPWNLGVFMSTISVIFIIIFFSIWIMDHLNYNMIQM